MDDQGDKWTRVGSRQSKQANETRGQRDRDIEKKARKESFKQKTPLIFLKQRAKRERVGRAGRKSQTAQERKRSNRLHDHILRKDIRGTIFDG